MSEETSASTGRYGSGTAGRDASGGPEPLPGTWAYAVAADTGNGGRPPRPRTGHGSAGTPADPGAPGRPGLVEQEQDAFRAVPAPAPATYLPAPATYLPAPAPGRGRRRRRPAGARPARTELLRKLLPQALVVVFLAGGTSAFLVSDKAVRLTVDGVPRTLHTFADDVGELLEAEGVAVGGHDIVAPGPSAVLASGDEVVVRYGRPIALTLDGSRRTIWTTAETVEEALRQLGVRAEGAYLSASRSAGITRAGLALDVRTERAVTVLADGRARTLRTNAATVAQALAEAGIALDGEDTASVPLDAFPRDGQTITVLRITGSRQVREEPVPYDTVRTADPRAFAGTETVVQQGRPGTRRVTYALRTVNGVREQPRKVAEELVRRPVTQRIRYGTRPLPRSVAGTDGLNWAALAHCESGGRPNAVDPSGTYGGLYQFDPFTWHSLGGRGRPQDAPASEQTFRAKKLYVQRGAAPWPHCGRRL
ncbi:ubiquitin-like domain-containing protein [Streptomyces sp. NPDC094448]|uniref:ubiquitin-like domain-containing protein n=1 Tax=Streptomyces sp. NPDC094448 TaxID=3366063 RepID=UPI003815A397